MELIVAAVLISTMISVAAPLTIRISHLSRDSQRLQLATDEVTDQLERLVILPNDQLDSEIDSLAISDDVAAVLPGAKIAGEVIEDELGRRIVVSLTWERELQAPPVSLTRWIRTIPDSENSDSDEPDSETGDET